MEKYNYLLRVTHVLNRSNSSSKATLKNANANVFLLTAKGENRL